MLPWSDLVPGAYAALKAFALAYSDYISVAAIGLALALAIEWRFPLEKSQPVAATRFNVLYLLLSSACLALARPLLYTGSLAVVQALGGGWIHFPPTTGGFIAAVLALLVFTDLLEYLFHRVQHALPWMWAMHELHHSEETYNVTLSYRHYWFEFVLKALLVYPIAGILLKVPAAASGTVALVFFVNHLFAHMNVPVSLGRLSGWISGPRYHRLHHSRDPRHYDKNFCDLFAFWDKLFGTQIKPLDGAIEPVGLLPGRKPATLRQAMLWPFVRHGQAVATRNVPAAAVDTAAVDAAAVDAAAVPASGHDR